MHTPNTMKYRQQMSWRNIINVYSVLLQEMGQCSTTQNCTYWVAKRGAPNILNCRDLTSSFPPIGISISLISKTVSDADSKRNVYFQSLYTKCSQSIKYVRKEKQQKRPHSKPSKINWYHKCCQMQTEKWPPPPQFDGVLPQKYSQSSLPNSFVFL